MNDIFNSNLNPKNNIRDILQDDFDLSFAKSDFTALRSHYRALRRIELESTSIPPAEVFDISLLAEGLTIAGDIVCGESGKNFIYCGNETSPVFANWRAVSKAILNLLSNAFLYGSGGLVTVKALERADFVSVEVQSGGCLPEDFAFGQGLCFVKKVCEQYNGHFFVESSLLSARQILLLPKARHLKPTVSTPDFFQLLNDKLSPVYVEFFGIT